MSAEITAPGGVQPPEKPGKRAWQRIGGTFLVLSILAHLLFFTGAAFYVIHIFTPKKLTFKAGAPSTNPARQLAEHKVSMAKKRKSMSAPAPAKRVVTTGFARIILPPMPAMPAQAVTPTQMTSIGGLGVGFGQGNGGNGNGDGGGGGFMAPFGSKAVRPNTLVGTFYDLKFLRDGQDAPDVGKNYGDDIIKFVKEGWHDSVFSKYLKGDHPLYATEIFFPEIESSDAPKAFGSTKPDAEGKWVAVYKGNVSPPETGVYHFIASGDDDVIIRFNNQTVLFTCEHVSAPGGKLQNKTGAAALGDSIYHYQGEDPYASFVRSLPVTAEAGEYYPIEILIGDDTPEKMFAKVLYEKDGAAYQKDGDSPILPIFASEQYRRRAPSRPRISMAHFGSAGCRLTRCWMR